MDLGQVLKNARKTMPYITTNSPVYFTSTATTNCDTNNINSRNINSQQQPETFDNIIIVDEQRRRRRRKENNERVEEENSEISEQLPGSPAPLYINHIMDVVRKSELNSNIKRKSEFYKNKN